MANLIPLPKALTLSVKRLCQKPVAGTVFWCAEPGLQVLLLLQVMSRLLAGQVFVAFLPLPILHDSKKQPQQKLQEKQPRQKLQEKQPLRPLRYTYTYIYMYMYACFLLGLPVLLSWITEMWIPASKVEIHLQKNDIELPNTQPVKIRNDFKKMMIYII